MLQRLKEYNDSVSPRQVLFPWAGINTGLLVEHGFIKGLEYTAIGDSEPGLEALQPGTEGQIVVSAALWRAGRITWLRRPPKRQKARARAGYQVLGWSDPC
jgi:hypothetical protein